MNLMDWMMSPPPFKQIVRRSNRHTNSPPPISRPAPSPHLFDTEELRSFAPSSIENRARSSFLKSPDILPFVLLLEQPRLVQPRLYRNSRSFVLFFWSRGCLNNCLDRIFDLSDLAEEGTKWNREWPKKEKERKRERERERERERDMLSGLDQIRVSPVSIRGLSEVYQGLSRAIGHYINEWITTGIADLDEARYE